jgi:hypothetical protein
MLGAGNRGPKPGSSLCPMEDIKLLIQFAPYLIPFLGAIILIIFTKQYLFRGMISAEMYKEQLERERDVVKANEAIANQLQEISKQLEGLSKKFSSEIKATDERTTGLEHAMSDYLDEMRDLTKQLAARPCLITQNRG